MSTSAVYKNKNTHTQYKSQKKLMHQLASLVHTHVLVHVHAHVIGDQLSYTDTG